MSDNTDWTNGTGPQDTVTNGAVYCQYCGSTLMFGHYSTCPTFTDPDKIAGLRSEIQRLRLIINAYENSSQPDQIITTLTAENAMLRGELDEMTKMRQRDLEVIFEERDRALKKLDAIRELLDE